MKLAEALIERAELQKKNAQLIQRITSNTKVQEGDKPAENPDSLIEEYDRNMDRLEVLIKKINETNSKIIIDNKETISEIIARRDCIGSKINAYRLFYESSTIRQERYSQKEVKFIRCIDAKKLQDTINMLSKEYREIDTRLQGINWITELL
jgi:G3E family GTPase